VIIVDTALAERERRGEPVRVGLIGAGYMGRAIARQLLTSVPGMRLVAVASRSGDDAEAAFTSVGADGVARVSAAAELAAVAEGGGFAASDDPLLVAGADGIDVVIEVTGDVELGARVATTAIEAGTHVVLMNAELDSTVGPVLKRRADAAGVVLTDADGDEPGVVMNQVRSVEALGLRPVLCGNIKGFYDPYRTPETQRGFAEATGQKAAMVTSFADGTKLSMESTLVANATGFGVLQRGMRGNRLEHVNDVVSRFDADELLAGGWVDFVLGAQPGSGAFVVGHDDDPVKAEYMRYFKMGDGPFYVFYRPFHLPHLEVALTAARAVLFHDAAVAAAGHTCDVVTVAKRDLRAGDTLDGIGGFDSYGMIENAGVSRAERLLPMGLAGGCVLTRDVPRDTAVSYDDVELPPGRLVDELRAEQDELFSPAVEPARASGRDAG
jgi:predicted homoserine dehydrogenase-like protein